MPTDPPIGLIRGSRRALVAKAAIRHQALKPLVPVSGDANELGRPDSPVYWFLMQLGMIIGFATAWPVPPEVPYWGMLWDG
ncbi:MAG: DUF4396 domain-containing protein [Sciscionella sp.]